MTLALTKDRRRRKKEKERGQYKGRDRCYAATCEETPKTVEARNEFPQRASRRRQLCPDFGLPGSRTRRISIISHLVCSTLLLQSSETNPPGFN